MFASVIVLGLIPLYLPRRSLTGINDDSNSSNNGTNFNATIDVIDTEKTIIPSFYWPICPDDLREYYTNSFRLVPNDKNIQYAIDRNGQDKGALYLRNSSLNLTKAYYLGEQFTISVYVKVLSIQNNSLLLDFTGKNGYKLKIGLSNNLGNRVYVFMSKNDSNDQKVTAKSFFTLNLWYHLAVVFNPPLITIYLNQVEDDKENFFTFDYVGQTEAVMGNLPGKGQNDFQIDDLKFYDYAFSQRQFVEDSKLSITCDRRI